MPIVCFLCCEYFFFSKPERFQSSSYIPIYQIGSIPLGVLADINEPYQFIPAENLSHFLPTPPHLKSFSSSHWVKNHIFNTGLGLLWPVLVFRKVQIGWSGSSHTPFLEALKPWDSSTFELVIEAGQDRGLDRVSPLTYLGLRFFICKIKCMIQVISSIPFSSTLLWILI